MIKKIAIFVIIAFTIYGYFQKKPDFIASFDDKVSSDNQSSSYQQSTTSDEAVASAFTNQQSDVQVKGSGVVIVTLADDTTGSRHQKFILKLASGQTLLISHNIDLAPRINSLSKGDTVDFFGEYEWNAKGGVVHWTHHDPNGRHIDGWLKHKGATYQ